jgi:hypothetical protein
VYTYTARCTRTINNFYLNRIHTSVDKQPSLVATTLYLRTKVHFTHVRTNATSTYFIVFSLATPYLFITSSMMRNRVIWSACTVFLSPASFATYSAAADSTYFLDRPSIVSKKCSNFCRLAKRFLSSTTRSRGMLFADQPRSLEVMPEKGETEKPKDGFILRQALRLGGFYRCS